MDTKQNLSQFYKLYSCPLLEALHLELNESFSYNAFIIFIIVINALSACISFCSNGILIYTIWKTESLRTTSSNFLILGLATSDFGVSISAQPSYSAVRFAELKHDSSLFCVPGIIYNLSIWTLSTASLLSLTAITTDRFLAIKLHLRYNELVTTKRCKVVLLSTWVLSITACVCRSWAMGPVVISLGILIVVLIISVNFFCIFQISRVIHRHSVQIQAQQQSVQQSIDMPRYKKSVNTMYYVLGAFLSCYLPLIGSMVIHGVFIQMRTKELSIFVLSSSTLVMFNSVLNPFIYCWRIREIRVAAFNTLRRLVQRITPALN